MTGPERDDDLDDDTIRVPRGEVDAEDPTTRIPRAAGSPSGAPLTELGAEEQDASGEPPPLSGIGDAAQPRSSMVPDDSDATVISRGRLGDETQPAEYRDAPGPRRHADAPETEEPDDGSTMVARRESRRRAAREDSPVAPAPAAESSAADLTMSTGRIAQSPRESSPIYKPRAPEPVIAERSTPPSRPPQTPVDTRAQILSRRRRARQLALVGVIGACFVVTILLAALVAFTTTVGR